MINIIGILLTVILFHLFVLPFINGFIDGYKDSINGKPYDDKSDNNEN